MVTPTAGRSVLFVCTGNTCRSPLAEAICKRALAERLGCGVGDLSVRGPTIASAGAMTAGGAEPSRGAVAAAAELGADLTGHRSQAVTPELLAAATEVYCMTWEHALLLQMRFPGVGPAPRLLGGAEDVPDPIGGDAAEYRACAAAVRRHVDRLLTEWLGP